MINLLSDRACVPEASVIQSRLRLMGKIVACIEELEKIQDRMQDLYSSGAVEGYTEKQLVGHVIITDSAFLNSLYRGCRCPVLSFHESDFPLLNPEP